MKARPSLPQMPTLSDADLATTDARFLEALASLNEIGAAIDQLTPEGHATLDATLRLIADSAVQVVPGGVAIIYTCDVSEGSVDPTLWLVAGDASAEFPDEPPQLDEAGIRAIRQRRRVLSYEENDLTLSPQATAVGAKAVGCFPLVVANQPVGALHVYLRESRHFGRFELLMLDNLVNHAAMAIYQARRLSDIQRDLERTEESLNRLWRAGMLISSRLGLDETLEAILQMALEVTGAHYGIFRLVDEERQTLVTRAIAGASGRPQVGALPVESSSIMGWVAVHRQPLCIHDLESAPWVRLYHPLDADLKMRSELAVPLVGSSGRLEGVLNLESPTVGAFGDQDRHLLQSLATQAVIAIQEARLIDALLEVAQLLLVEPHTRVLEHLVAQASDLLDAASSAIWSLEGDELVLLASTDSSRQERHLPLHGSLTGQAVLDRAPVVSQDVRKDPRFRRVDLARRHTWTRALIVPLLSQDDGKAIGALSVYGVQGEQGRFTESEWDKKVLTCLAHYATLALQNADRQRALRLAQERHAVAETFAAVGDVAANVLHHLNNKVGTIPVRVQGIQDKCQSTLSKESYLASNLAEIERSAREAMDAVRDSVAYLRPIHLTPVSVMDCVLTALEDVQLSPGIQVEASSLVDLPPVVASQRSLAFVFTNLLENAAAAMEEAGVITLRGCTTGSWIEVEVEDNGPGISPDLHARIFEFSLPTEDARRNGKLGFGLWWVKTLLMRLGGAISVESDGHHGTTFRLRLPRAESDHA
ncbi:MAG: GAF domain-containing protein [Anaerolineae bacterium]